MRNRSIFRDHPFPAARMGGRPPVFLDFTLRLAQDGMAAHQPILQILSPLAIEVDGMILSSREMAEAGTLAGMEIWVRADNTPAILSPQEGQKGAVLPQSDENAWVRWGAAGVVGTLLLGNSPAWEADNVQHLARLRTQTRGAGLPLAIDLHILTGEDIGAFPDVVEMGVNLAVELGGDFVFLPAGEYLRVNKNIRRIAPIPIFARQPAGNYFAAGKTPEGLKELCAPADGVVFTHLQAEVCQAEDPKFSPTRMNPLSQPVGGDA